MGHRAAVIGLGVMGQRMLGNMAKYAGFEAVAAWDPDPVARERCATLYPGIDVTADAAAAIRRDDVQVVYIACPPLYHAEHASAALDAGKAVYCEKPLDVDAARARALVEQAEASGLPNIVNLSLASAVATRAIEQRLSDGVPGTLEGVDICIHFSQWPRAWQMDAASWLAYRADGGFTREVLSHWIYLTQRLLGPLELRSTHARYPDGADGTLAETHVVAALDAGPVPVTVAGSVGGRGPDRVEWTLYGSQQSLRVVDWNQLYMSDGGDWQAALPHIADAREAGYELQLANAAAAVAGEQHSMPLFRDAMNVQILIEAMLA